jgi:hypothetical protein
MRYFAETTDTADEKLSRNERNTPQRHFRAVLPELTQLTFTVTGVEVLNFIVETNLAPDGL